MSLIFARNSTVPWPDATIFICGVVTPYAFARMMAELRESGGSETVGS
jgi:hypothetical protein